ncbi:MAG: META domain-containing protein [Candidatus Kapabacteria bacterium]|nr:META domain-containing protein [Candidatus Kapabacteria bacterium]
MKKILLTIAVSAMLWLTSCEDPLGVDENYRMTQEVTFETVLKSNRSYQGQTEIKAVIRSKAEEEAVLSALTSKRFDSNLEIIDVNFGNIDYGKEMLVVFFGGPKPSSSIYVEISSIIQNNGNIVIGTKEYQPEIGTTDIGYPIHIVKTKHISGEVEFEATKVVKLPTDDEFEELQFESIRTGSYGIEAETPVRMAIRSKAEEVEFLKLVHSNQIDGGVTVPVVLPDIDYSQDMYIIVMNGPTSSGSIYLRITSVILQNQKITVNSTLFIPQIGTDDIGYPFHLIKLKKRSEPVEFSKTDEFHIEGEGDPIEDTNNNLKLSAWSWVSFEDSKGNVDFPENHTNPQFPFTIIFKEDFYGSGISGCNAYSFGYFTNKNNELEIKMGYSTLVHCELTAEFMAALGQAESYKLMDDKLIITTKSSSYTKMSFRKIAYVE